MNDHDPASPHAIVAPDVEAASTDESVLRLAAARAALDPERQTWRHDILVSAVVSALGLYGPLTTERLLVNVSRTWATGTVSRHMIDRTLEVADAAGLIVSNRNLLSQQDEWSLPEETKLEATQDRDWVRRTFHDFGERLVEIVNDLSERPVPADRGPRLAQEMFAALARGASGTFAFAESALAAKELRPAVLDTRAAAAYLKETLQPSEVAGAMQEALVRIMNPDDPLGNDVLRLLVVGNILQGLLSGRDTAASLSDIHFRFVLDTSALMFLVDGSPERQLVLEFLERCRALDAQVVVGDHTLAEYERVWKSAEREVQHLDPQQVRRAGDGYVLVGNVVTRAYVRHLQQDATGNWARFSLGRRDIRPMLEGYGVVVRDHGNDGPEDRAIVEAITGRLLELSDSPTIRGDRTPTAAAADAHTCAMVARWRRADPSIPPAAWMVGSDRLTDQAYAEHTSDVYPLCLPTSAALLLMSNICGDDSGTMAGLVDTLSAAVTRDSFLAVAASYTFDEVLDLAEKMAPGAPLSDQDAAIAVQLNFEAFITEFTEPLTEPERRARATRAVQRRGLQQSARARRIVDTAELERGRLEKSVEVARAEGRHEGRLQREAEVAEERRLREEAEEKSARVGRAAVLAVVATIAAATIVLLTLEGRLGAVGLVTAAATLVTTIGLGIKFVVERGRTSLFVVDLVVAISSSGAGALLDWLTQ